MLGGEVMLASNSVSWSGLHNGTKGKVADFVYTTSEEAASYQNLLLFNSANLVTNQSDLFQIFLIK